MKKYLLLPLAALSLFAVAIASKSSIQKVDAAYETKTNFADYFDTNEINQNWRKSGDVSLYHHYSSLRFNPEAYAWDSSVNLNSELTGSYKVNIELSSSNRGGWFAVAFGNTSAGTIFTSMKGGVVFFDDEYSKALDIPEDKLDSVGDYHLSAFSYTENVRRTVSLTVTTVGSYSTLQCEIFEGGLSKGRLFDSPYVYDYKLDGYMGFNSNLKNVEIYSVEILNSSSQRIYYDDFTSSSILYPTSGSASSEWYSTKFNENELKIGFVSSLYLENINSGVTYINALTQIDNKDIDLAYVIETQVQYSAMDFDVESGFKIAMNEENGAYHFFGVRRLAIGYALIHYEGIGSQVDKLESMNENENLTVNMQLLIHQNGDVKFVCGELEFTVNIPKYEGYVGLFNTNVLNNLTSGSGAYFSYFKLDRNYYYKRDTGDKYMNFNGIKKTYYEDVDEYAYEYFISRQEWNVGYHVSSSKWKSSDRGNGKLEFNTSAGNSFFGPKAQYKDFVVKFDVEVNNVTIPYGGTLGLEFGLSRPGVLYDNAKSLGIGYYNNTSVPAPKNCNYTDGANDVFFDDNGDPVNIYDITRKFTLMYISRDNVVSLYYLLDGEDDSHLNKIRTSVTCKEGESFDGYLAIFGANGISFTVDNLSIINLDLDAPYTGYSGSSNYQEVTRLDFANTQELSGLTATNANITNGKVKINNDGELKTSKLVNDYILRLRVDDIENTMSVSQGNLNIKFVNQLDKYVEINDNNSVQRHDLSRLFDYRDAVIEIEKINTKLNIRILSGGSSLSLFDKSVISFEIVNPSDDYLVIKSLNGFVNLKTFTFVNLNKYATIANRDYDPETDNVEPWPYRPTGNESSSSKGCSGDISYTSLVIFGVSLIGLLIFVPVRRRIRK